MVRAKIQGLAYSGLVLSLLSIVTAAPVHDGSGRVMSSARPVAILGAFAEEVESLRGQVRSPRTTVVQGRRFTEGVLRGRRVVVAQSGIGKVNAAAATALMLERFHPSEVLFTGIAGGVNSELRPGDIVLGARVLQHDYGAATPGGTRTSATTNPVTGRDNPLYFAGEKRLLGAAQAASRRVRFAAEETSVGRRTPRVLSGTIATGDVFVSSSAKVKELREAFQADAVEMEGGAVAQICWQQGVPCLVIRSLSDSADENAHQDLGRFYKTAAANSARLTVEIVAALAATPVAPRTPR
ncbi:MAG TPA: 5'-methylthioadenosine/adenosylhomocysteine nucleosidase [Armatimonadota bacterium]|jgi:adenosylhomocysteine nucleosidase